MIKNTNILDEIVKNKKIEIEALKAVRPLEILQKEAVVATVERRPLRALFEKGPVLIAEIKPRSPSEGRIIEGSPFSVADIYAKSKADVISVLTDEKYFGGSMELLQEVRSRVPQAILRKDFIIEEYQVYETALSGADAFLLIAAILSAKELETLRELGNSLGLETLVEVHDKDDLDKAIAAKADVIGINNRNLKTLKTDISVTEKLIKDIPKEIPCISESGIYTREDVTGLKRAGIRGILVGTSILQSKDPLTKIAELKNALYAYEATPRGDAS